MNKEKIKNSFVISMKSAFFIGLLPFFLSGCEYINNNKYVQQEPEPIVYPSGEGFAEAMIFKYRQICRNAIDNASNIQVALAISEDCSRKIDLLTLELRKEEKYRVYNTKSSMLNKIAPYKKLLESNPYNYRIYFDAIKSITDTFHNIFSPEEGMRFARDILSNACEMCAIEMFKKDPRRAKKELKNEIFLVYMASDDYKRVISLCENSK